MTPIDVPPDPLLDGLARLRRDLLDDMTAARTLSRAEAALDPAAGRPATGAGRFRSAWVPAALAAWSMLYVWSAVGQLGRVYGAEGLARSSDARVESQNARRVADDSAGLRVGGETCPLSDPCMRGFICAAVSGEGSACRKLCATDGDCPMGTGCEVRPVTFCGPGVEIGLCLS